MSVHWRGALYLGIPIALLVVWGIVLWTAVTLLNADLYGRLTETQTVGHVSIREQPTSIPTIRLVLHRLLPDENAVEASLVVIVDYSVVTSAYWRDAKGLTAGLHDASSFEPVFFTSPLSVSFQPRSPGDMGAALRSARFLLPAVPSMVGFPFDDVQIMVMPYLRDASGYTYPFTFEVQKALPGRLLSVSGDPLNAVARMSRSPAEQSLVVLSGVIFVLLSAVLALLLFRSSGVLKGREDFLAFAGYVVGAAGFRQMLGVSRATGASVFEITVFGLPLVALTGGMVVAVVRSMRTQIRERKGPIG